MGNLLDQNPRPLPLQWFDNLSALEFVNPSIQLTHKSRLRPLT